MNVFQPNKHEVPLKLKNGEKTLSRAFYNPQGKIKGMFIGINDYSFIGTKVIPSLDYAVNDAIAVCQMFLRFPHTDFENMGLFIDEENCKEYFNEISRIGCIEPRTPVIIKNLNQFSKFTKLEDIFIFFFSGHGVYDERTEDTLLLTKDTVFPQVTKTALPLKFVINLLKGFTCKTKLILIDACRTFSTEIRSIGALSSLKNEFLRDSTNLEDDIYIIMSCRVGEKSQGDHNFQQGIFTYHLIKGIQDEAAADEHGNITIKSLFQYLQSAVNNHSQRFTAEQTPEGNFLQYNFTDKILITPDQEISPLVEKKGLPAIKSAELSKIPPLEIIFENTKKKVHNKLLYYSIAINIKNFSNQTIQGFELKLEMEDSFEWGKNIQFSPSGPTHPREYKWRKGRNPRIFHLNCETLPIYSMATKSIGSFTLILPLEVNIKYSYTLFNNVGEPLTGFCTIKGFKERATLNQIPTRKSIVKAKKSEHLGIDPIKQVFNDNISDHIALNVQLNRRVLETIIEEFSLNKLPFEDILLQFRQFIHYIKENIQNNNAGIFTRIVEDLNWLYSRGTDSLRAFSDISYFLALAIGIKLVSERRWEFVHKLLKSNVWVESRQTHLSFILHPNKTYRAILELLDRRFPHWVQENKEEWGFFNDDDILNYYIQFNFISSFIFHEIESRMIPVPLFLTYDISRVAPILDRIFIQEEYYIIPQILGKNEELNLNGLLASYLVNHIPMNFFPDRFHIHFDLGELKTEILKAIKRYIDSELET